MSLEFINPQLATAVDHPPPRAGWIHEVKHDGYRTLLIVERRKARAYTRNGFDWTDRYPGIINAAVKLDCRSAIIDGEIIIQNKSGVADFDSLKSAIRWRPQSLIFCAFDLLHLNGKDFRERP
jgi:bifunctional non-homologous end joining protein LigD